MRERELPRREKQSPPLTGDCDVSFEISHKSEIFHIEPIIDEIHLLYFDKNDMAEADFAHRMATSSQTCESNGRYDGNGRERRWGQSGGSAARTPERGEMV